ncbi:MAG: hypothetical protein RLZZ245_2720, partial [Verrucomicrobiota bacterium]
LAISPEFKQAGSTVSLIEISRDADHLPDFTQLKQAATTLHALNVEGKILALHHIGQAGVAAALAKLAFGNHIGAEINANLDLARERYFTFLIEHVEPLPAELNASKIGLTTAIGTLALNSETHTLNELQATWEATLEPIYPTQAAQIENLGAQILDVDSKRFQIRNRSHSIHNPKVLIPSFPGTNSEYDSAKAFHEAGANAEIFVFRNLSARHIEESIKYLTEKISNSQILMFPGGFSAGDEPDGSAKFIATIIRSPRVADAIMDLLQNRDGLILGICNGFQALIKTGLVPYGEIREASADAPSLVHNSIGRHISRFAQTRIVSTLSPWLANNACGDVHQIPVSHGEGKFYASPEMIAQLAKTGQIATQYCDEHGTPSMLPSINPNGSMSAIEGITSPCGRIFGKMGHSERTGSNVAKNIPGVKHQRIFEAGVQYFS